MHRMCPQTSGWREAGRLEQGSAPSKVGRNRSRGRFLLATTLTPTPTPPPPCCQCPPAVREGNLWVSLPHICSGGSWLHPIEAWWGGGHVWQDDVEALFACLIIFAALRNHSLDALPRHLHRCGRPPHPGH